MPQHRKSNARLVMEWERKFRRQVRAGNSPDRLPLAVMSEEIAAIRKALIVHPERRLWTDAALIAALHHFAEFLQKVPSLADWNRHREWAGRHGYPLAPNTIRRHLGEGTWVKALRRAGLIK